MRLIAALVGRALLVAMLSVITLLVGCGGHSAPAPTETPVVIGNAPALAEVAVPEQATAEISSPGLSPVSTQTRKSSIPPATAAPAAEVELPKAKNSQPPNLLAKRPIYDTSRPFAELVKPHFYALNADGAVVAVAGEPESLVILDGRARVRLANGEVVSYLDLLALESELVGEHPIHKVYRLVEMGIPPSDELARRLEAGEVAGLFANVEFEYQRRSWSSGVIAEVFPDGTFLVIPDELPAQWQSSDDRIASPTHLHINARALSGGSSPLAREYELEILSLPFDDQRYPPAPLARKQCDVYRESLATSDYRGLLASTGFRFTPAHALKRFEEGGGKFSERTQALLWEGSGADVQYFGFESSWIADVFKTEGAPWLGECDTAGGLRSYPGEDGAAGRHYLTVRRSLEPDKKQRYRVLEVDENGEATELYTAPGIILMALPLPLNHRAWLFSTEGWTAAAGDQPADPRWQAVYLVNLDRPDEYVKVRYPIDEFPKAPEAGLYGASPRLSSDGDFLFNTLYGFKDEGGGIWVVDVSAEDFHTRKDNFARIVSWDHTLSWMPLGRLDDDPSAMHLFMTGKEVADDFAMTANVLRIREDGLNSAIEKSERLLQMVGWNPVPVGWQKLSDTEYRMLVETHYNYESSLMPRAKGVYIVPVSLNGD